MNSQLRRLALARQGLLHAPHFGNARQGTLNAIEHLGYVQIDTISMIERAHHHVLWSRVPGYQTADLNQLMAERQIFEYWFHAAAYLPMRDYRFAQRRMAAARNHLSAVDHRDLMREILQRVQSDGPLRVRDLEGNKTNGGTWWNWGPGKRALEKLFFQGDLMVSERIGMEKVYDLRERILPAGLDVREPDLADYAAYLLRNDLRAHCVVTLEQLTHLHDRTLKNTMRELIAAQIASGEISAIDGIPNAYAESATLAQITDASAPSVHLLSPFDNAVIHRKRLQQLFGFEYRLECYVPAAKRQYGYFCLPILFGERFVGRIDCKAHRKEKRLEVISLHLEINLPDVELFFALLKLKLQQFAEFNGCEMFDVQSIKPAAWRKYLVSSRQLHAESI
ncbi:winged helix-turn-helix domain-containing protein [Deefgea rivuli]|uniref:winged helix-turn-helix domain-containing protein n=1 Tax=Deefgea rivuli TaxID=400948 RepID=UPI0006881CB8|nr:crosslink repair DNA glycosylase YcaQ family protein [Deefgea rivuli]